MIFFLIFENLIIIDFLLSPCSECCIVSFWAIPSASGFCVPTIQNTLSVSSTCLHHLRRWNNVPKRRHIVFIRRGIHPKRNNTKICSLFLEVHTNFAILSHWSEPDVYLKSVFLAVSFCSWVMMEIHVKYINKLQTYSGNNYKQARL